MGLVPSFYDLINKNAALFSKKKKKIDRSSCICLSSHHTACTKSLGLRMENNGHSERHFVHSLTSAVGTAGLGRGS
jgi:hypothetical protein